jgi:hypothetical protein
MALQNTIVLIKGLHVTSLELAGLVEHGKQPVPTFATVLRNALPRL